MTYQRTVLTALCVIFVQVEVACAQLLIEEKAQYQSHAATLSQAAIEDGIGKPIQRELKVGDCLIVTLDGQAATLYASQLGLANPDDALTVPISCRILSIGTDGKAEVKGERFDVNHTGIQLSENDETRLMSVEATIDLGLVNHPIRWHATKKTNEFATFEESSVKRSVADPTSRIRLKSASGLTIRMWALVGAINNK